MAYPNARGIDPAACGWWRANWRNASWRRRILDSLRARRCWRPRWLRDDWRCSELVDLVLDVALDELVGNAPDATAEREGEERPERVLVRSAIGGSLEEGNENDRQASEENDTRARTASLWFRLLGGHSSATVSGQRSSPMPGITRCSTGGASCCPSCAGGCSRASLTRARCSAATSPSGRRWPCSSNHRSSSSAKT